MFRTTEFYCFVAALMIPFRYCFLIAVSSESQSGSVSCQIFNRTIRSRSNILRDQLAGTRFITIQHEAVIIVYAKNKCRPSYLQYMLVWVFQVLI